MKEVLWEINVDDVTVGKRARKSLGSLDALERSIERLGVMQPIGITPSGELIFGARRLQASKNLGRETIPARVFDINADDPVKALQMERAENEHRLDLTPSEKVALAKRIEEALGNRQGQRTDIKGAELPQNFGEVSSPKERESSAVAADAVGWNRETYRQAKSVVESGNEKLIQQMDSKEKSVSAAYEEARPRPKSKTFKITLYRKPEEDAELLITKAGNEYCTELACALLKMAGHKVDLEGCD